MPDKFRRFRSHSIDNSWIAAQVTPDFARSVMNPLLLRIAALALFLISGSRAAELKSGGEAPKIRVASWAQGEGVKEFEGDKVYIVEFWATWCGPCVAAIPHLNDTYRKYKPKGLVVVGMNLGEDAATVSKFVKGMGSKMTYNVGVDEKTDGGWMAKHWLAAAGQNGIPCAFVVNKKGRIAYIGHPMELKESLLESLLDEPSARTGGASQPAPSETAPSAKAAELAARAQDEIRAGKLDEAESTIGQLSEELPPALGHVAGLLELDLLLARKQPDDAVELSKLLVEDHGRNPVVLAAVAAHLAASGQASPALLSTAERISTPLAETPGEAQGTALSTLARIAFLKGDKTRALELQTRAVPLVPKSDTAAARTALESYRK